MPALDIATDLDNAVRAALSTASLFTQKVGDKFFASTADGLAKSDKMNQPNSWPRAFIGVTLDESQRPPLVFAMNATAYTNATVDVPVPCSATVVLALVHQNIKPAPDERRALETSVRAGLMAKWPKLNRSYVTVFSINERSKEESSERTKGERRAVTEFTIQVTMRPMLSQLVG